MSFGATQLLRVYADTSVYGGVFDAQFATPSQRFFEQVRRGRFQLVVSGVVLAELRAAPYPVQVLFEEMLIHAEIVEISDQAVALQHAYLDAGILMSKSTDDALHVALATVNACSMIVSWNFRHIVHFQKMPLYNAVNVLHHYKAINIHSPSEVIEDEDHKN